jgi:hypothetical protein
LIELRRADGSWNGIAVRRLKDKLGTRALPTAELDLEGAVAVPVGGLGRGVAKIATMLNISRIGCATATAGTARYLLQLSRDYARRREALGRPLGEHALHRAWIARIAAEVDAMTALTLRAAELFGAAEAGADDRLARVVVPLCKLACTRAAVTAVSELLESFGGAGYLEDTGLPRLLRNVHVHCIWEGTSNVMALDVLRALGTSGAAELFLEDVRARAHDANSADVVGRRVNEALGVLGRALHEPDEGQARRLAWGMARTYQAALLCEHAAWARTKRGDVRAAAVAEVFTAEPLVPAALSPSAEALAQVAFDR